MRECPPAGISDVPAKVISAGPPSGDASGNSQANLTSVDTKSRVVASVIELMNMTCNAPTIGSVEMPVRAPGASSPNTTERNRLVSSGRILSDQVTSNLAGTTSAGSTEADRPGDSTLLSILIDPEIT